MANLGNSTQNQTIKLANSVSRDETTEQFKLNANKFAQLGDAEDFSSLKTKLIARV